MQILFNTQEYISVYMPLAKEIGLYESLVLLKLYEEISERGIVKDGIKMRALTNKQLKEALPFCRSIDLIRKILDKLQVKEYIYISENTLFSDNCLWFGLNVAKLMELKSITILSEEEIQDAHIVQVSSKSNGSGKSIDSHRYTTLYGAYLKACHWDKALNLSQRDRAEVGQEVKALMKRYPDRETENLKLMVLGIDVYRNTILRLPQPYRPSGISRAWGPYSEWCMQYNNGNPPEIPKDWL